MCRHADHEALRPAAEYEPRQYPKPDGKVSFDLTTSLYRSGTNHEHDQPSHLKLKNKGLPAAVNLPIYAGPESHYCPAGMSGQEGSHFRMCFALSLIILHIYTGCDAETVCSGMFLFVRIMCCTCILVVMLKQYAEHCMQAVSGQCMAGWHHMCTTWLHVEKQCYVLIRCCYAHCVAICYSSDLLSDMILMVSLTF